MFIGVAHEGGHQLTMESLDHAIGGGMQRCSPG